MKVTITEFEEAKALLARIARDYKYAEADNLMEEMRRMPLYREVIFYVCPECGRRTEEMTVMEGLDANPHEVDKKNRPGMEPIAHEVLSCPCGEYHNWYSVHRKSEVRKFEVKR